VFISPAKRDGNVPHVRSDFGSPQRFDGMIRGVWTPGRHGKIGTVDDRDSLITELRTAVEHRTVIGIALGMVMAHRGLSRDDAFVYLQGLSSRQERKLYDIARDIAQGRQSVEPVSGRRTQLAPPPHLAGGLVQQKTKP
jgi:hypothetical protein